MMSANRWLTRRLARRGQHGFSLLITMVIMAVAFLLVGALLTTTLTSTTIGNTQLLRAREWRAADGAMDAAVNQALQDTTGRLGSAREDACNPVQPMTIDTVAVEVKCAAITSDEPYVPVEAPDGAEPNTVRVLGDRYIGDPSNIPSSPKSWKLAPDTCPATDLCYPWNEIFGSIAPAALTGSPRTINNQDPTVRHTGPEPLQIVGQMDVRKGTGAARNQRSESGTYVEGGPGLTVRGDYSQGDPGLLSNLTGEVAKPANERACGVLSPNQTALAVKSTQIVASESLTCDDATARALNAASAPAVPLATSYTSQAVPACGASSGRVIYFEPGRYDATQTKELNKYLRQRQPCDNKLLVFKPGGYWFDVDDPVGEAAEWRNQLRFNDPTSVVIFGTVSAKVKALIDANKPVTPAEAAKIQAGTPGQSGLCDPTAEGVTITLSPRTSIRHDAGRVAICGATTQNKQSNVVIGRAIQQAHAVNLGWEATPGTVDGGIRARCIANPGPLVRLALDALGIPYSAICDVSQRVTEFLNWGWNETAGDWFDANLTFLQDDRITSLPAGPLVRCGVSNTVFGIQDIGFATDCWGDTIIKMRGFEPPAGDDIGAPIDSAQLIVESDSVRADGHGAYTRIDVSEPYYDNGKRKERLLCSVRFDSVNIGYGLAEYELIKPVPGQRPVYDGSTRLPMCGDKGPDGRTLLRDRKQLYESTVMLQVTAHRNPELFENLLPTLVEFGVKINDVKLRTGMSTSTSPPEAVYPGDPNKIDGWPHGGDSIVTPSVTPTGGAITVKCWQPWDWGDILLGPFEGDWDRALGICPSKGTATLLLKNVLVADTAFAAVDVADPKLNPKLTSLGVSLNGRTGDFYDAWSTDNAIKVEVQRPNGSTICTAVFGSTSFPHEDRGRLKYLNLLGQTDSVLASGSGNCNRPETLGSLRAADLAGTTVRLTFTIAQTWSENASCRAVLDGTIRGAIWGLVGDRCFGYYLMLDQIKLISVFGNCTSITATCQTSPEEAYDGPSAPMVITQNNQPTRIYDAEGHSTANAADAVFNVYGDVSIPRSDLDVVWAGPVPTDPAVVGNLWVNGIGSSARVDANVGAGLPHVGVLCCEPAMPSERVMRLEAWVGTKLRGVAQVRIKDTKVSTLGSGTLPGDVVDQPDDGIWSPGSSVKIDYWQLCNNQAVESPTADQVADCLRT